MRDEGYFDNTLLIIASDHGEEFGEHDRVGHQFALYDTLLRVPFLMRLPGRADRPERRQDIVELTDVFATILDSAGISLPESHSSDGKSLLNTSGKHARFAEYYQPTVYLEEMALRYPEYDRSVHRRKMRSLQVGDYKLIWSSLGNHELYDVAQDPGETRNLANRELKMVSEFELILSQKFQAMRSASSSTNDRAKPEVDDEMRERLRSLGYVQ
jgi:arylsulfatase A-like enzyme